MSADSISFTGSEEQSLWVVLGYTEIKSGVQSLTKKFNGFFSLRHAGETALLEEQLMLVERGLNWWGYFPVISNLSAVLRVYSLGAGVILFSAVKVLWYASFWAFYKWSKVEALAETGENLSDWAGRKLANSGLLFVHSVGNIVRSFVEFVPLVGNLACIIYDHIFGLRMRYNFLDVPQNVAREENGFSSVVTKSRSLAVLRGVKFIPSPREGRKEVAFADGLRA
jgi:hypothetical protein